MIRESIARLADADVGSWVLVSTILASSMAFIDGSALNVALPAVQAALHASGAALLWVVNAYLLMLAALILIGGSLGDALGRKRVFMFGIALFLCGSLASGLSPTIELLIAARVLQGIGGALMIPGSLAIISAFFRSGQRGQAIGTWAAATTIVTVVGPVLGGFLSNAGLWRGVFLINLPIGIVALIVLYFKVPESRSEGSTGAIDWLGALLVMLALAGLTYGFISAPDLGFSNPTVAGALAGGILALVAFVIVQARSAHPMVPLRLFRSHTFSGTNLLTLFLYGALSVGTLFLSLNLVQAQGYNLAVAGFAFTPFALILTALSRWAGGLVDRVGARLPLIIGPALAGVGFLIMAFPGLTPGASSYWTTFFPGIAMLGIGMGITVAPLSTGVMNSVSTDLAGTASGINNAVSRTAGVLAIAIIGAIALVVFANALQARTAAIQLPDAARTMLASESAQLGAAAVPPQVPPESVSAVANAIALVVFANALQARTAAIQLPDAARTMLASESAQLGAAAVPPQVPPESAGAVANAIRFAFVDTFNVVMLVCTALAWLAALMAAILVEKRPEP